MAEEYLLDASAQAYNTRAVLSASPMPKPTTVKPIRPSATAASRGWGGGRIRGPA